MITNKLTKKGISVPLLVAVILAFILSISLLFAMLFYEPERIVNTFTVGINTTHINEEYEPPTEIPENESVEKKVTVFNDDNVPCYVRVFCEYENSSMASEVTADFNTDDWTKSGDYYYYNQILNPGEETTPLITSITAGNKTVTNFKMIVASESVQAQGFNSATDAFNAVQ